MDLVQKEADIDVFFDLTVGERFTLVHDLLASNVATPALPADYELANLKPLYLAALPEDEIDYFDEDVFAHFYANPGLNEILTLLLPKHKLKYEAESIMQDADDELTVYLEVWQDMLRFAEVETAAIKADYDDDGDVVVTFEFADKAWRYDYEGGEEYLTHNIFNDFNDFAEQAGLEQRFLPDLVDEYWLATFLLPKAAYQTLEKYSPIPGY